MCQKLFGKQIKQTSRRNIEFQFNWIIEISFNARIWFTSLRVAVNVFFSHVPFIFISMNMFGLWSEFVMDYLVGGPVPFTVDSFEFIHRFFRYSSIITKLHILFMHPKMVMLVELGYLAQTHININRKSFANLPFKRLFADGLDDFAFRLLLSFSVFFLRVSPFSVNSNHNKHRDNKYFHNANLILNLFFFKSIAENRKVLYFISE